MELADMTDVDFPEMRENILSAVRALSDSEYQDRVWVRREYPQEGYFDDFSLNLNILFDDTLVLEEPTLALGKTLRSQEEVAAMTELAERIELVLKTEGSDRSDAEYMESRHWPGVVESASRAYLILTE
ncbi:SCO4402 family protein [Streptomyces pseudovenezuelae]|uniref:Immunity protein 35 domain-containing protein n=1 Tax=Streptomyces pseudovenezuelae TaxID=67350 RepID=A0ABT6M141_9ACTN|nr:hypothetical protein [Streptomyces pseudovenezuelae]MDH6221681.1 hypothetical protein [Streptomyces pseudovenezuelae]